VADIRFALVFGLVSERAGIDTAGWLLVAIAVVSASLMILVLPAAPPELVRARAAEPEPPSGIGLAFAADRFLPADDPEWPGHWAEPPVAWADLGFSFDGSDALEQARRAIAEMPPDLRQVIVLRDVEGEAPGEVQMALGLSYEDEQTMLHQARGLVRARLDRHFEGEQKQ
jgi:DNA-directed RNA polymerase specialized sigma24 family protein